MTTTAKATREALSPWDGAATPPALIQMVVPETDQTEGATSPGAERSGPGRQQSVDSPESPKRTLDDSAATLLPEFVRERDGGLTYREIGERHGLSHERVRQILTEGGVAPRERNWAAEYRKRQAAGAITEWLESEGPTTSDRIREKYGLTIQQLSELMGHGIPKHLVLAGQGRTGSAYDDDALADAVRQAWARFKEEHPEAEKFSVNAYEAVRLPGDPSLALITSRVPWKQVCSWADVPCSKGRGTYDRAWDDDGLLDWVGKYVDSAAQSEERVTFYGYDKWRKAEAGAPSGALVRTRLRRSGYATWGAMVSAATHPGSRPGTGGEAAPYPVGSASHADLTGIPEPESIPDLTIGALIEEARRFYGDE